MLGRGLMSDVRKGGEACRCERAGKSFDYAALRSG
jgi:hypothetical protein